MSVTLVAACTSGGGYYQDDGPPRRHAVDLSKVADAVPRREPLSKTGNRPYVALGKRYHPLKSARGYREKGIASWYGRKFHGKRTSSGETYDMYAMTAAHRTLPIPSYVRVRNLDNGKSAIVKVNDRGPFLHNRVIDLSYAAAYRLGIASRGTGLVEVTAVFPDSVDRVRTPAESRAVGAAAMYVQVGAFAQATNAETLRRRLERDAFRRVAVTSSGDRLYRVRIGPVATVGEVDELVRRAEDMGYEANVVVE